MQEGPLSKFASRPPPGEMRDIGVLFFLAAAAAVFFRTAAAADILHISIV